MATITNAELTVTTNRPDDHASVVVTCEVQFTEVEVNAMNLLGLQYTLHCQVLNKELLDEVPVVTYQAITYPLSVGLARGYEHAVFDTYEGMQRLHERLIGKDKLVAKITLRNEETQAEVVQRTEVIAVDLAA